MKNLTPEERNSILQFAIKFGLDAALAIIPLFGESITIDTAIAALQSAKTKSAQQYLDEAKAALPPTA